MVGFYNSKIRENIAKNINFYMAKQNKNCQQMWEAMNISRSTFMRLKAAHTTVTLTHLLDLCELFDITLAELTGEA